MVCPANAQNFNISRNLNSLLQAVRSAIQAGADIINISSVSDDASIPRRCCLSDQGGLWRRMDCIQFSHSWLGNVILVELVCLSSLRSDVGSRGRLAGYSVNLQRSSRTYLNYYNFFANASTEDPRTVAQSVCQCCGEHKGRHHFHWRRFR